MEEQLVAMDDVDRTETTWIEPASRPIPARDERGVELLLLLRSTRVAALGQQPARQAWGRRRRPGGHGEAAATCQAWLSAAPSRTTRPCRRGAAGRRGGPALALSEEARERESRGTEGECTLGRSLGIGVLEWMDVCVLVFIIFFFFFYWCALYFFYFMLGLIFHFLFSFYFFIIYLFV
jgi:hypothetical protein